MTALQSATSRLVLAALLIAVCLSVPSSVLANDLDSSEVEFPDRTDEGSFFAPVVTFKHSGAFRFRSDLFGNRHLYSAPSPGTTGMLPPLSQNGQQSGLLTDSEERGFWTGGANMRLRWEPQLVVGERFNIYSQLDVLDNLVMGSTPSYHPDSPHTPLAFLSEGQQSPSAGTSSLTDAIRVKRVWATWLLAHTVEISGGRMPNHWGLGMIYNDGSCLDCDFGDNIDRLSFGGEFMDIRTMLAWDFGASGAVYGENGVMSGQPIDATRTDDVLQFTWDLHSGRSVANRGTEAAPTAMAWGWRNVWRNQAAASDIQDDIQTIPGCSNEPTPLEPDPTLNAVEEFECLVLRRRDAWLWTTDVFFSLDHRLSEGEHLRFEMELVGNLMGELGRTQGLETVPSDKEVWAGGGVLRGTYEMPTERYSLELGFATGDELGAFGVLDQSTVAVDDSVYQDDTGLSYRKNNILSSLMFNRAYTVDLLMFREAIGAVTNTVYIKPWVELALFKIDDATFGSRLDVLYAAAMMPSGTPGNGAQLGIEPDLQLFLNVGERFRTVLEAGVLIPFSGLDDEERGRSAETAWTIQGRMHVTF